jgi:hypothetical protein
MKTDAILGHVASWGDRHPQRGDFAKDGSPVNRNSPRQPPEPVFRHLDLIENAGLMDAVLGMCIGGEDHAGKLIIAEASVSTTLLFLRVCPPVPPDRLMIPVRLVRAPEAIDISAALRFPVTPDLNVVRVLALLLASLLRLLRRLIWLHASHLRLAVGIAADLIS